MMRFDQFLPLAFVAKRAKIIIERIEYKVNKKINLYYKKQKKSLFS